MTENKRFEMKDPNCWGYPITDNKTGTVYNCNSNIWMKELVGVLNALHEENEQLKQQLKSIEDSFKFSCTENHIEFNKDKLKVEDAHTELTLKDGKLCISVFVSQLNEYVKFFYWVTGRKMEREFINYDGDVE